MKPYKIVFIHSLNNYTGSPNALSVLIRSMVKKGYQVELITSRGEGFLSALEGVRYRYTCYQWSDNKLKVLLLLLLSQLQLFVFLLFAPKRDTIYYINTIVPFGAAFACRLTGKTSVYHVHENMQQQKVVYHLFRAAYRICNRKSIFVSNYLKETALNCKGGTVVYNALNGTFEEVAERYLQRPVNQKSTILMVASLRRFKGVYEFAELARRMPQYPFELVVNATNEEVAVFRNEIGSIKNLSVYPSQKNLHPFYQRAKLLLQLSHPESCVETFGLTILEAMVYGVPSIAPNVGGPVELVDNDTNGYTVNPHDIPSIIEEIKLLMEDEGLYQQFSEAALRKSAHFSEQTMTQTIENYIISQ